MCLVQDRQKLILLLQKAYFGQLSEEEAGLLAEWRSRSSEHEALYRRIMSGESLAELLEWQNHFDPEQANRSILHRVEKRRSIRMRKIGLRVAAIVLLLLGIGTIWIINRQGDYRRQQELAFTLIHPGTPQAILTLADGRQVVLDKKPVTLKLNEKQFLTGDSAILNYAVNLPNGLENNEQQTLMHKVEVPVGGEYRLVLADGTKVWINAESSLQYPVEFTAEQRTVILQGEAYFEVAKDPEHPFVVEVEDAKIEVLGTIFNVSGYAEEERVVTTLVEGVVRLSSDNESVLLEPNEQGVLDKDGHLSKVEVNVFPYVAWQKGLFVFRQQSLERVMQVVSRWYDVKVVFKDEETKRISFTGNMRRYGNFEQVVRMLEMTGGLNFNIEGRTIYITEK